MSIFRVSIPVGMGLALVWGLTRLGAWLSRGQAEGEPALRQPLDGAQACTEPSRSDQVQDTASTLGPSRSSPAPQGGKGRAMV